MSLPPPDTTQPTSTPPPAPPPSQSPLPPPKIAHAPPQQSPPQSPLPPPPPSEEPHSNTAIGGVLCPDDAPVWFRNGFREISREALGAQFEALLLAYIALERRNGFAADGKPKGLKGTAPRPHQVTDWIRDGRGRGQSMRAIPDISEYQKIWWAWWAGLQPEWRKVGDVDSSGGEWGSLAAPGPNGMLSVVASIYWWGCAEKALGQVTRSEEWGKAAADTIIVLRGLQNTPRS
ncbi:hypothetical protein B0H14DRAFT_2385399 [Mycena olivaceomarginata]|nr:hypothetical protein B0H14DRAFT_2385399 [Mycena olivaceomarginata]